MSADETRREFMKRLAGAAYVAPAVMVLGAQAHASAAKPPKPEKKIKGPVKPEKGVKKGPVKPEKGVKKPPAPEKAPR